MSRNANGEGTISQRNDGRWQAVLSVGFDSGGKLCRKYFYGKTRKEAYEKMLKFKGNCGHAIPLQKDFTLSEWLQIWLDTYKKFSVKPRTFEQYESIIRLYLKPNLGRVKLSELTSLQVQAMLNKMYNDGLSRRTVELTRTVLRAALNQAKKSGLINALPTEDVTLPKKDTRKPQVLTPEEQNRLMQCLCGNYIGRAIIFALYTGLRRGEVLALQWSDFDGKERCVEVSKLLSRVKSFDGSNKKTFLEVSTPKTETSCRTVPLIEPACKLLAEYKKAQKEYRNLVGGYYDDQNLIFSNSRGGYIDPGNLNRKLKKVAEKAGIPGVSSHVMRHTFATRGLEAGVSLKAMQEFLGHSSIQITGDIYTHILKKQKQREI